LIARRSIDQSKTVVNIPAIGATWFSARVSGRAAHAIAK
jgi:hypothetical protein